RSGRHGAPGSTPTWSHGGRRPYRLQANGPPSRRHRQQSRRVWRTCGCGFRRSCAKIPTPFAIPFPASGLSGVLMQQRQLRLGDILDDYCPRERRVTNHAIVAMVGPDVKQTRCTTCDAEHEYKHARIPRKRKKGETPAALYAQVAAGAPKRVVHEEPSNGGAASDELDSTGAIDANADAEPDPVPTQNSDATGEDSHDLVERAAPAEDVAAQNTSIDEPSDDEARDDEDQDQSTIPP